MPLLDELSALGGYFAVETHAAGREPTDGWLPLDALTRTPAILDERIAGVRSALAAGAERDPGEIDHRVAASVAQLGLVARLVSPVLASGVIGGELLRVELPSIWWRPVLGGPYPLSMPEMGSEPLVPSPADAELRRGLLEFLDATVGAIVAAVAARSVSSLVLWGNVASAINGSASMLVGARPELADRTRLLAGWMLEHPRLRGGFVGQPASGRGGSSQFQRRSCCLIYRATDPPSSAYCGDCIHLLPLSSVLP
ncbi:FhuF 2Fe-2S C-terminal domain-containing protein [Frankineae bacterium MT45]|nr:FhuF 2Fe-2S C-terminal domain-containing protein [Frankineae bacterium MT45]